MKILNKLNTNPSQTFWINNFENCKSPAVLGKISIEEFLHKIKHGDENLVNIEKAREYGKGHDQYDKIKKTAPKFWSCFFYTNFLVSHFLNGIS